MNHLETEDMLIVYLLLIILFCYGEQELFSTSFYPLKTKKLRLTKGPIRIVHLSDLHSKSFGHQNRRLIQKIKHLNPDFIVTTGDMITSTDESGEVFLNVVESLIDQYPIFYIEGTHEITARYDELNRQTGWYEDYLKSLEALGVHLLNNEQRQVIINDEVINVCGFTVPLAHYYAVPQSIQKQANVKKVEHLHDVLPDLNLDEFNLLLAHNPFLASLYEAHGFDQVYCGHVHGGAIRLPFIGGVLSPERTLFPKYSAGVYQIGKMKMIVSRGLGRLRLFNRPEIVVVDLMPQDVWEENKND